MTPRQRVLSVLDGQKPDRTPRLLYGEIAGYVPAVAELLDEKCSPQTPAEHFDMDITGVFAPPTRLGRERFGDWLPAAARKDAGFAFDKLDEWGVWWRQGGFYHFAHLEPPLADASDPEQIERYPWPDLDEPYRHGPMVEAIGARQAAGRAVACFVGSIFEQGWYLRGMRQMLEDMMLRPRIAHCILDRTAYYQRSLAAAVARGGVDLVVLGDDIATQHGPMMSLPTWRTFLKGRLKATIDAVKAIRPDAKVFYHSCGQVREFIPELIEVGVDVLNPVQPDCMDPAEIKRLFGQELVFCGTISVQKTMPFGAPQDVRREVARRIRTVGYDGGLILSPAHVLEPDVSWENIVAFFEAADAPLA